MGLKSRKSVITIARLPKKLIRRKAVTQSQASKIRRALIKTDRLSERQNQGNLTTQSHGSTVIEYFF